MYIQNNTHEDQIDCQKTSYLFTRIEFTVFAGYTEKIGFDGFIL